MKKCLVFLLTAICILGISGCGHQNVTAAPSVSTAASTPAASEQEKSRTEQDVISMFSKVKEKDWEYVDCVLTPDHASGRIGAVLFRDSATSTSNVAFFDADGFFHQCGPHTKLSDQPDFTYLGDGTVTFQAEDENGAVSLYRITISIHDGNVFFKTESEDAPIGKVKIAYGNSALYSEEDMNAAIQLIMDTFSTWAGCELHSISYVSDEKCNSENIAWMNELAKANDLKKQFDQCILFQSDFHSPKENSGAWEPDEEYTDWQWWLARSEGGPWILMTNGYG